MASLRAVREALVRVSRRFSRVPDEAEDLAHDILLSALQRGLDLHDDAFLRIAHGAARRHAAFLARCAERRRSREERFVEEAMADAGAVEDDGIEGAPLAALAPTLRTTFLLLAQGLDKAELRVVLGANDAALRKRFQALREHGPLARPAFHLPRRTIEAVRLRRSQVKLLPRLAERKGPRLCAFSDPDGHGLIVAAVLTKKPTAATSHGNESDPSLVTGRNPAKGHPC